MRVSSVADTEVLRICRAIEGPWWTIDE